MVKVNETSNLLKIGDHGICKLSLLQRISISKYRSIQSVLIGHPKENENITLKQTGKRREDTYSDIIS